LDRDSNHNNRGYGLAWFLVNDRAKRLAYRIPDPAKAGTPSDLTSQIAKRAYKLRARKMPLLDFAQGGHSCIWSGCTRKTLALEVADALVMLSDILPTGFECGVLNGKVQPGNTVAIVGAGPIGLAGPLTAQFYSPAETIVIDLHDTRLEMAKRFGATASINSADGKAVETVLSGCLG
jgi:Zn-dependent alcohol dehydrogenase